MQYYLSQKEPSAIFHKLAALHTPVAALHMMVDMAMDTPVGTRKKLPSKYRECMSTLQFEQNKRGR